MVPARHRQEIFHRLAGGFVKDAVWILGSESDKKHVEPAAELMQELDMSFDILVYSAHRNLPELLAFLGRAESEYHVFVAAAGLSAALPGVVASQVKKPVIGVPLVAGELSGIDALLSILQLPKGVPVATMGIGKQGVLNAVHLTQRIIALRN
jgi:5-(carboxyamino)imidazole ribonucleotide mutase